jgi:hypothetical protein
MVYSHDYVATEPMSSTHEKSMTQAVVVGITLDLSEFRHPQSSKGCRRLLQSDLIPPDI